MTVYILIFQNYCVFYVIVIDMFILPVSHTIRKSTARSVIDGSWGCTLLHLVRSCLFLNLLFPLNSYRNGSDSSTILPRLLASDFMFKDLTV